MEEVNYRAIAEVLFCSLVHLSLPESASAGLNHQLCPVPGHETCGELVWELIQGITVQNPSSMSTKISLSLLDLQAEVLPELTFLLKEVKEQNKDLHSYSPSESSGT